MKKHRIIKPSVQKKTEHNRIRLFLNNFKTLNESSVRERMPNMSTCPQPLNFHHLATESLSPSPSPSSPLLPSPPPLPLPLLQDVRTACGVMYECVLGIPMSEGMQPPPKIPTNPSFVELDEDENAVETFKTAMANITSILAVDKLKQVGFVNVVHCLYVYQNLFFV